MDDLYLDNIDEYVNDQNKIVTYKWLSLTLGVHVNTAKQMLHHYIEQRRKERSGSTLQATYLVSGKCVENGSMCHKVSVVREDKLEDVKSKLDVTISVHVYSVQKAELKDSAPLYSTDYDAMKENLKNCNKYSAIRCAAAVPMSTAELQRVQDKVMSTAPDKEANKPVVKNSAVPASKRQKGIMGMFSSKAVPKSEEQSREVKMEQIDDRSPAEGPKTKVSSKASTMNNFFGKSADKKLDKPDKNTKDEADGSPTSSAAGSAKQSSSKSKQDINEELLKVAEVIKDDSKETRSNNNNPTNSKTKRLEHSDSEDERVESQKKKRRRIKNPHPDSSDDEVIPDSPPAPELQTQSPEKHVKKEPVTQSSDGRRRKRRRVLKSHTFVDDEDCIVTEKGYESESYSESEDESKAATQPSEDSSSLKQQLSRMDDKKKVKEKSQKKTPAAANKGTKQASITGFFQKK